MIKLDWRKRRVTSVVIPVAALSMLAAVPVGVNAFAAGGTASQ
jgi:hypothetical protein